MSKNIYLGKGGKHFGPFDQKEVDALKRSGDLDSFAFIWDPVFGRWELLHAAPAPLPRDQAAKGERFEAVCHDGVTILSGYVDRITERGCHLVSEGHGAHAPRVAEGARVRLNLLDPRSGKSTTIQARMGRAARSEGACRFELQWDRAPEVLLSF